MDNLSEFRVNQADTYLWLAHPEVPFGFPVRGQRQKKMRQRQWHPFGRWIRPPERWMKIYTEKT